ncbi:MAG: capsule assembly Wzi family protein [Flavobacteriales bacterium]|nr:hypothetical protein [Flavobacteriales bacterium]
MIVRQVALRPLTFLTALTIAAFSQAQQNDVPFQRDVYEGIERNAARIDDRSLTGLKPVLESRVDVTGAMGYRVDSTRYFYWLTEKLFRDHLLDVREGDLRLTLDPLFRFEVGLEQGDATPYADTNRFYQNVRGFRITGDLGPKVSFQTMFHETQAIMPQYLFRSALAIGAMPSQGRVKFPAVPKMDFGWSQSSLSYSPARWINLQLGHGKHFVGHGYRSVLLSDNTIPAPYLQLSLLSNNGRWHYTTWHTKLEHGVRPDDRLPTGASSESLFWWMRARFDHLGVQLGRVELGLFESTIFRNIDEEGIRPFDALELNPVIGVNTAVNGFGGEYKQLVGVDLRIKVVDKAFVYGQFGTDDPEQERYAWQAGLRCFDVGLKDLNLQLEYNTAVPFMYMDDPVQLAYMHAGSPMAHPMGANFSEVVAILEQTFRERWRIQAKLNLATYHRDRTATDNHGSDLDKPDIAMTDDPPLDQELMYLDVNASYLFNPKTNLRFIAGVTRRDLSNAPDGQQSTLIHVSVSTALFNRYYDL